MVIYKASYYFQNVRRIFSCVFVDTDKPPNEAFIPKIY